MDHINAVREDMKVVDSAGKKVGRIRTFKAGDPQAVTAAGQRPPDSEGNIVDFIRDAFDGDDLPEQRREHLLRTGYIQVDATGLGKDFYVPADEIASVDDDAVRLAVDID